MTDPVREAVGERDRFARVSELIAGHGLRLATAESCTGGLVAAGFTARSGASRFFEVGFVTYSDSAKQALLGVQPATLDEHGAVSEAVALEMVAGALKAADIAVAITGVAGPDGGTPQKPVGTVWIAAGTASHREARLYHFEGDRSAVRAESVTAALDLLKSLLEGGG